MGRQVLPKTKRSHGPNIDSLAEHAPVLTPLLKLSPNGYPDCYSLAATLEKLHELYNIMGCHDDHLSVHHRAMLAADRWRIMCKHSLLLASSKAPIHSDVLKVMLNGVNPTWKPLVLPIEGAPADSAQQVVPFEGDTFPDAQPPPDLVENELPGDSGEPTDTVPYNGDGTIDWETLEDNLPEEVPSSSDEEDCVVRNLDFSQAQSSRVAAEFHRAEDADVVFISQKCNCQFCRKRSTPPPKKPRHLPPVPILVGESPVFPSPPAHFSPAFTPSPSAAWGPLFQVSPLGDPPTPTVPVSPDDIPLKVAGGDAPLERNANTASRIEQMANNVPVPSSGKMERLESLPPDGQKRKPLRKNTTPVNLLGAPVGEGIEKGDGKGGSNGGTQPKAMKTRGASAKPKAKANAKMKPPADSAPVPAWDPVLDFPVEGPYTLTHRFKPIEKSQCYLMGTVNGISNKFITGIGVARCKQFSTIMENLKKNANSAISHSSRKSSPGGTSC